ncbi:uncharacterized protein P174DRAFT_53602 [Aspergillus novofumigatus IBT 16806]|uniref:Uncharacterized protein n=1 Tax=Aspergillus novofumigatus (strain IBT 16806) TaxID=1392255 RepID=A0A2I1CPV4_ASPN1|nr:uncharacterized protein P174DRAFT_53602 [Aspergillus novofumigatus IBT 16806]PKX99662.1 hypothetical protein P174DRAFT_53602 [Aspergillus novofumigatus IBT 16806]
MANKHCQAFTALALAILGMLLLRVSGLPWSDSNLGIGNLIRSSIIARRRTPDSNLYPA